MIALIIICAFLNIKVLSAQDYYEANEEDQSSKKYLRLDTRWEDEFLTARELNEPYVSAYDKTPWILTTSGGSTTIRSAGGKEYICARSNDIELRGSLHAGCNWVLKTVRGNKFNIKLQSNQKRCLGTEYKRLFDTSESRFELSILSCGSADVDVWVAG